MSGYIDRDLALSMPWANGEYDHEHANEDFIFGLETYKEWLENLPTADVVEVKHGKWDVVADYDASLEYGVCSVCGGTAVCDEYCGKCGAKMDS